MEFCKFLYEKGVLNKEAYNRILNLPREEKTGHKLLRLHLLDEKELSSYLQEFINRDTKNQLH